MKRVLWLVIILFAVQNAWVYSQQTNTASTNKFVPKLTSGPTSAAKQLTDEQIASLKTEWVDEKTSTKYEFGAYFGAAGVDEKEKKKYIKSGKVPYRITCSMYEIKTDSKTKKSLSKRMSGTARFYLMDSEGKVLESKSASLDKMCPS